MKYSAYLALVASAQAAVHSDCTKTWKDAADSACDASNSEICVDWLSSDQKTNVGLFCAKSTDCGKTFKYTPEGGSETEYYAQCDGLSLTDCSSNKDACFALGGFKCADWTATDGKVTIGCAGPKECGTTVDTQAVACVGLLGEACSDDKGCDANAKYRCGVEFNNQTYNFVKDAKAMCSEGAKCGQKMGAENSTSVLLCYNDAGTKCDKNTTCAKPDGATDDVICGYLAPGGANMSSGMCVDKKYCPESSLNGTGANVTYFGKDTMLWCGSARTALAMGAAAISAYLAM